MANTLVSAIVQAELRHVLTGAAASFVAAGWITGQHAGIVVGVLLEIAPVVWSAVSSWNNAKAQAVVTAVQSHPDITVTPASETGTGKPIVTVRTTLPVKSISGV